jgi:diguanylate cyclase (GGDEF)-like protein
MADDVHRGELQRLRRLHRGLKMVFGLSALVTVFLLASGAVYLVRTAGTTRPLVSIIVIAAAAIIVLHLIQAVLLQSVTREVDSKVALLVLYDDLTGVYNYRYLEQRLDQEIVRSDRGGHRLSVIYIDSDNFKKVNDRHDHQVGNQVLRQMAGLLRDAVRSNDLVGRLGGDEFLAILPETGSAEAQIVAGRILERIRNTRFITSTGAKIDFLTLSMGISSYPDIARTRQELILQADHAMYEVKKRGGNSVAVAAKQEGEMAKS